MTLSGFWSYVHADDHAEGGRVAQLGRDIAAQFELLTGDSIELFLDRDSLEWGAQWQLRIEASLASVAFFVPVLTPRYFASPACRGELQSFARRADRFGVRNLLLPILYSDLVARPQGEPEDDLVALARSFQWEDWRDLRFEDRGAGTYRRAVHRLAERLVEANREAETVAASEEAIENAEDQDDELGSVEVLAAFEESVPALGTIAMQIAEKIGVVGEVTSTFTNQISTAPPNVSPFAFRLRVVRDLAQALSDPAHELGELGERFASNLHDMDLGVRAIIAAAPSEPESRQPFCAFFDQIRTLSGAADAGLGPLESMIAQAEQLETLSREMRPVIREMRRGLTLVVEGRQLMAQWVSLIDALQFDCTNGTEHS